MNWKLFRLNPKIDLKMGIPNKPHTFFNFLPFILV